MNEQAVRMADFYCALLEVRRVGEQFLPLSLKIGQLGAAPEFFGK